MPADRLSKETLGEQVTRVLREAILFGEFAPGERLSEPDLAKRFDVSLTPVREALGTLAGTGLVVRGGRRGTHVRRLDVSDVENLVSVREALDVLAVRQAVDRFTDDDFARFARILDDQERETQRAGEGAADAIQKLASLNDEFHRLILHRSQNPWLSTMLESIDDLLVFARARLRLQANLERRRESLEEHRRIVQAIADSDPDAAAARMSEHVRNLKLHVLSLAHGIPEGGSTDPDTDPADDPSNEPGEDGDDDLTRES